MRTIDNFGRLSMRTWTSRTALLFSCFIAAFIFYSSLFAGPAYTVVGILAASAIVIVETVRHVSLRCSPQFILNLLISLIVGFASAIALVFFVDFLTEGASLSYSLSPFIRFLLPVTTTSMAFWGLQAFSPFRAFLGVEQARSSKKIIPDLLALEDGRIVDLARTGILNGQLLVPSFVSKRLTSIAAEHDDDSERIRAKKALDSLHRLEALPKVELTLFESESASMTIFEIEEEIVRFSKSMGNLILTCDHIAFHVESDEELYISMESIANALRSPIPKGESLPIKIQRLGKEPKQGIGYLDDGTMVVVNGGGDFLGRTVKTQVLSQKYSSSGKIVFCNVREECEEHSLSTPYTHPDSVRTHESLTSM
jgi:uncharacterized protein YacL